MRKPLIFLSTMILSLLMIIILGGVIFEKTYPFPESVEFGVSFSPKYATFLNLDWQKTYLSMLNDLKVKNLRLNTSWDDLEKTQGDLDFSSVDFMLEEGKKHGVRVILVVGVRQPRWPECHIPPWAKSLSVKERQQEILNFITKVINRYKDNNQIWAYQVENEPLLSSFGEGCDAPSEVFLRKEVELVRSLTNKQIILTDSGELGDWSTSMKLSDIFGTTIYREVYNNFFGYATYPIPAYLYNIKANLIKTLVAPNNKKTIIVEFQSEPWIANDQIREDAKEQSQIFTLKEMKESSVYIKKTGFDESYLWGVEWWYWMDKNGYPAYLDYAKKLF